MTRPFDAPRLTLEVLLALLLGGVALGLAHAVLGLESVLVDGLMVAVLVGPPVMWRVRVAQRAAEELARRADEAIEATRLQSEARASRAADLVDTAVRHQVEVDQAAALELALALARAVDIPEAAEAVNEALARTTGLARSAVLLFAEDGVCRFVGWRGLSAAYRDAVEGHCPWKQDAPEAEAQVVGDVDADVGLAPYHGVLAAEGIATLAFVPVMGETGVVGKLMLYGATAGAITPAHLRAARIVAVSLGAAVTRLRMADALARSESRLRAVIDTAMDAVVSMDRSGRVTGWNGQAEAILGWSAAEALGRPLDELMIPPELRASHREGLERYLRTGESVVLGRRVEVPAVRKDGTTLTVELAIAPVRTSDGVLFSGFLRDITDKKHAAEELEQARAAAEAASRAKSEFLANMSHEIRTPLTAILGYAELLRDDGDLARAPERRVETIHTIQVAGQHLLTILNDILDLSKIEAGKMTVEAVETPVLAVLNEVVTLMRPRAAEKGVELLAELQGELPDRVLSDPTRVRQILMNLVGNAVKFTQVGRIAVAAREELLDGRAHLVFEVDDTGPGLTLVQAGRLFRSFGQADASVTRRHGGSGLGLAISHRLAQLLGGVVCLQRTAPGQGSCFRLELPLVSVDGAVRVTRLEDAEARPAPRLVPPAVRLAGRVLVAEDGRDNQFLIAFHLRRAGAEVQVAANGVQALASLERAEAEGRPFDLLLTDIQMPEMDGYTLVRTLRERESPIPIVALTAHAMAEDRQRCLDAGCDDFAVKPIDRAKLLETCARWLGRDGGSASRAA